MRGSIWKFVPFILLLCSCTAGFNVSGQESAVETLYNKRCAGCHGFDGHPARKNLPKIPDFTDPEFHRKHTDKELETSISEGRPPLMPAFKSKLDEAEIRSLREYIRNFNKKN